MGGEGGGEKRDQETVRVFTPGVVGAAEQRARGSRWHGCLTQAVATAKEPLKCARGLNASFRTPRSSESSYFSLEGGPEVPGKELFINGTSVAPKHSLPLLFGPRIGRCSSVACCLFAPRLHF